MEDWLKAGLNVRGESEKGGLRNVTLNLKSSIVFNVHVISTEIIIKHLANDQIYTIAVKLLVISELWAEF